MVKGACSHAVIFEHRVDRNDSLENLIRLKI